MFGGFGEEDRLGIPQVSIGAASQSLFCVVLATSVGQSLVTGTIGGGFMKAGPEGRSANRCGSVVSIGFLRMYKSFNTYLYLRPSCFAGSTSA